MQTREEQAIAFAGHRDIYSTLMDPAESLVPVGDRREAGMAALVLAERFGQMLGKIRREAGRGRAA